MTNEELKMQIKELRIAGKQSFLYDDYMLKAADSIEELVLTNASRQWISVNERLPDVRKSIIFATKSGYAAEGEYIGDCWIQYRWATKVKNEEVTHWMALPELPKKESGA